MELDKLTLGEIKQITSLINSGAPTASKINERLIGKYCIFRTYSAGVFFGKLAIKEGKECIIDECRRLYYWKTNGGISLTEVAITGLHSDSKVCAKKDRHWIEAIEIIACTEKAIESIKDKGDYVN